MTESDFDIYLLFFYILPEYPHFSISVQSVYNRPLGIILDDNLFDYILPMGRRDFQFSQCLCILATVISENDSEYTQFSLKATQEPLYIFPCSHNAPNFMQK